MDINGTRGAMELLQERLDQIDQLGPAATPLARARAVGVDPRVHTGDAGPSDDAAHMPGDIDDTPTSHDEADDASDDAEDSTSDDRPEGRLTDVRVLIVDDDADVLESFEAAFAAEGALTLTAADGNEAVRICLEEKPELVILDMMLPKRSGFLALEKIKGNPSSPKVIMVTANEGKRHQGYAESLGVDAYLQKPVPLNRLLEVAEELLRGG